MTELTVAALAGTEPVTRREGRLRQAAEDLEAAFLAEMLRHSGLGASRGEFGGGAGEDQFASFLRTEHARALARQGRIGLAESLFQSLLARAEGRG